MEKDKELLLKDLCTRLPYGVKCIINGLDDCTLLPSDIEDESEIKPYLRPMSGMTEEERFEVNRLFGGLRLYSADIYFVNNDPYSSSVYVFQKELNEYFNWLNAHHFDYHGLIEKGLAIEVTEENNPYKE